MLTPRNRVFNWLSVAFASTLYVATTRRRYDAIFVSAPPITLALPALCAWVRYRVPLFVDVRDVFPEIAIRMGHWKPRGIAARSTGAIARTLYRVARLVFCVTASACEEVVARGCPRERCVLAPNGFDRPSPSETAPFVRREGDFVAAFVGNMGLATGIDAILDAATLLTDRTNVRFVLAGDGADRVRLEARVRNEHLDNVTFLGVLVRPDADAVLATADVAIVPLHLNLVDSLPTKLFDALALGCPVICCARGEASQFVTRSGGGLAIEPHDGHALARAIVELQGDKARRDCLGRRGRAHVFEHHDRARIMQDVARRLRRALGF
ncbi:MAG: hypothetical protein NVS2B8_03230 [Vulcanimicrobiaceae bacterium]